MPIKTFKQFITETTENPILINNVPVDLSKLKDHALMVYNWYEGDFMNKRLSSGILNQLLEAFKYLRQYTKGAPSVSNPIYRLFSTDELLSKLEKDQQEQIKAQTKWQDKQKLFNQFLDGKDVSLNTGLNPIQSWTQRPESIEELIKAQGEYGHGHNFQTPEKVIAKSSFSSQEIIWTFEEFEFFINKMSDTFNAKTMHNAHDVALFMEILKNLYEQQHGYEFQKEIVVDTTQPRKVEIFKILEAH